MRASFLVPVAMALLSSQAAAQQADEIILYSKPDFKGANYVVSGQREYIQSMFQVRSIRLPAGAAWEVCTGVKYNGCRLFSGSVANLQMEVGSARPARGRSAAPAWVAPPEAPPPRTAALTAAPPPVQAPLPAAAPPPRPTPAAVVPVAQAVSAPPPPPPPAPAPAAVPVQAPAPVIAATVESELLRGLTAEFHPSPTIGGQRIEISPASAEAAARRADQYCYQVGLRTSAYEALEIINGRVYLSDVLCTRRAE